MDDKLPTTNEQGVVNSETRFGTTVYSDGTIAKKMTIGFDTASNMVLFWDSMAWEEDEIKTMNFNTNEIEIQEYVDFNLYRQEVFVFWNKDEEE
jgi:hypothetical protein